MTAPCPPALVCSTAAPWPADASALIDAAVELISSHYALDLGEVWGVVLDLESEMLEETGLPCFGRLLERPWGFSTLGLVVAQTIIPALADKVPLIHLRMH